MKSPTELTPNTIETFNALLAVTKRTNRDYSYFTISAIADAAGLSAFAVRRALEMLVDRGFVAKRRTPPVIIDGRNASELYRVSTKLLRLPHRQISKVVKEVLEAECVSD